MCAIPYPHIRLVPFPVHAEDLGGKVREGTAVFLQEEEIGKCLVRPHLAGL